MNYIYSQLLSLIRDQYTDYEIINELEKSDVIQWIKENVDVDDCYPEKELEKWAESHGYVKE
jgi:hypothetical protein